MLRVIGDVHGKVEAYQDGVAYPAKYSIQIGDMAFDYKQLTLDPNYHKFFGGNHDNYDTYYRSPHALNDYGHYELGDVKFFYLRGAFSIDVEYRKKNELRTGCKSWWEKEECTNHTLNEAVCYYNFVQPSIVLSHDGPDEATDYITNPDVLRNFGWNPDTFKTRTQQALTSMFHYHKPKLWIFGHYHKHLDVMVDGTRFICLPELQSIDIDAEGNIL